MAYLYGAIDLVPCIALLVFSGIGLVYLWWRIMRRTSSLDLPRCRKCGYIILGLQRAVCPECGADLHDAGIKPPRNTKPISFTSFAILWSLLLPLPALTVSGVLIWFGPMATIPTPWLQLTPLNPGQYQDIRIHTLHPIPLSEIDITISGNGHDYVSLMVELPAMTYLSYFWSDYATTSPPGSGPNAGQVLDHAAVLDLLRYVGADTSRQDVIDEASELVAIVQVANTNQGIAGQNTTHFTQSYNNSSYNVPAKWFIVSLMLLWCVVWLSGFVLYFRVRRMHQSTAPKLQGMVPIPPSLSGDSR
jgi:hypothetical protein